MHKQGKSGKKANFHEIGKRASKLHKRGKCGTTAKSHQDYAKIRRDDHQMRRADVSPTNNSTP